MNRLHSVSRIWASIVISFVFFFSYPLIAQSKVRKNSVILSNTLHMEDGRIRNAAEPGEILVYKLSLRNRSRKPQTIHVIERVPLGTTHLGGDDFEGLCGNGSAGQICKREVTIPGRRDGNHELFFRVQVDNGIDSKKIRNKAIASGVVCRSRHNDCHETTLVENVGVDDQPPRPNSIQLRKSLFHEDGKIEALRNQEKRWYTKFGCATASAKPKLFAC